MWSRNGKKIISAPHIFESMKSLFDKDSSLIFFDEATSALDKKVEIEIFEDIKENFHGKKTLIISSHNYDNLKFCDEILDFSKKN